MAPFIDFTFAVDDVPTDLLAAPRLSSPNSSYGLRRSDNAQIVVADNTVFTRTGVGTYRFDLGALDLGADVIYDYWIKYVYNGELFNLQRFIVGTGVAVEERVLRFVAIQAGVPIELLTVPRLSSPTETYGVVRTDTKVRVVADGTPYTPEGGSGQLYRASFGEPVAGLTYRYYVEVTVGGVTYHIPSITRVVNSAILVLGRYTDSYKIQQMFSADSVHKWMTNNSDEGDEPTDYATRVHDFIYDAEGQIDEFVGRVFSEPPPPRAAVWAATALAGVLMYEGSGIIDMNAVTGEPEHRYAAHRRRAENLMKRLRGGDLSENAGSSYSAPGVVCVQTLREIEELEDSHWLDTY